MIMRNYLLLFSSLFLGVFLSMPIRSLGQLASTERAPFIQDIKEAHNHYTGELTIQTRTVRTPDITPRKFIDQMKGIYFLVQTQRQDIEILKAMVLRQDAIIKELQSTLQKSIKKDSN